MPRHVRRNVYKLENVEWNAYAAELDSLKTAGDYDDVVELHQNAMLQKSDSPGPSDPSSSSSDNFKRNAAHRGPAFLPWHRRYVEHLESLLPAGMAVPYWPWEADEPLGSAGWSGTVLWSASRLGTVDANGQVQDGPFAAWQPRLFNMGAGTFFTQNRPIERFFTSPAGYLPSSAQVTHVLSYTSYDNSPWFTNAASVGFRNRLEGFLSVAGQDPAGSLSEMHNAVHIWVDGDMGPGTSPNDPVFFLHHANIDRIWAKWQEERRFATGQAYASHYLPVSGGPPGHNRSDTLFPWSGSGSAIEDMLDLTDQDFVYDDVPIVTLKSTLIDFQDVIAGETAHAAAVFDVIAAFPVKFELLSLTGPDAASFTDPFAGSSLESLTKPDPVELDATGYGWVAYTGEAAPTSRNATATIRATLRDPKDNALLWQRDFSLAVTAASIARPSTAVSLVLDQSDSMSWTSGFPSKTRMDVLHFSAPPFIELLGEANGIGVVAFDHEAYERMGVAAMPGGGGTALAHVSAHQHNPQGGTSIADGISAARTQLGVPFVTNNYDDTAVVILTDGHETQPGWLADLPAAAIDERVYAVGLGSESTVESDKLELVVNNADDGFILLTGDLDAGTDAFLLSKYFLKILAGVQNDEIGKDPEGSVTVGQVVRVPFLVTEADTRAEAILLTEHPVIDMALETPDGEIIDLATAATLAGVQHVEGQTMQAYRVALPAPTATGPAHAGTWHALLRLDPHRIKRWMRLRIKELTPNVDHDKTNHREVVLRQIKQELDQLAKLGATFSFNLILRSNLKMTARVHQSGYDPGDDMLLRVSLIEYRQPIAGRARVSASLRRPDGSTTALLLAEVEPGVFETVVTGTMPGVWRYRLLAEGDTLHGRDFEREDMLTGFIKDPARPEHDPSSGSGAKPEHRDLCSIAKCLLADKGITRWLEERGVDVPALRKCVLHGCDESEETKMAKLESLRAVFEEALLKFVE